MCMVVLEMLCKSCHEIRFKPCTGDGLNTHAYILHRARDSFQAALALGCSLCSLISAKLDAHEIDNDTCHALEAYIVLLCNWKDRGHLRTVTVASRRGAALFDVIESIPDKYHPQGDSLSLGTDYASHDGLGHRKRRKTVVELDATGSPSLSCINEKGHEDWSTGSTMNLELARTWLQECRLNHETCNSHVLASLPTPLPTRLIDIRRPDGPILVNTDTGINGPYVALSYCWGYGKKSTTIKSNYHSHLRGIPSSAVPRTFADGIQVARNLGYRFIWIDAYCIIQQNDDDLNRELPKMGDIYRYADFTIYAAGAASSHSGAFVDRDPLTYRPCRLSITIATDQGDIVRDIVVATSQNGRDYLEPRGWVLQERILSSRCLIFGKQMAWSCSEAVAQETNPAMRQTRVNKNLFSPASFRSLIYRPPQATSCGERPLSVPFRSWYTLVENYSDKELTESSDNLNAVSGLAALFQQAYGVTYMAGLWKENLHAGLAWYVASNDQRPIVRDNTGPAWSWASVGKVRIAYRNWQRTVEVPKFEYSAQTLSTPCQFVDNANPYGPLKNAVITIRTHLRKARLLWSEAHAASRMELSYGSPISSKGTLGLEVADERERPRYPAFLADVDTTEPIADVAMDMPRERQSRSSSPRALQEDALNVWCALLHVEHVREAKYGTLLVMEATGNDTFKRVGLGFVKNWRQDWMISSDKEKVVHLV